VNSPPACDQVLTEGVAQSGNLTGPGDDGLYCISVETGDQALVTLDGPNTGADIDLYLKVGSAPTLTDYDVRGYTPFADEIAALTADSGGMLYIWVVSYSGNGGFSIQAQIDGAQPAQGQGSSVPKDETPLNVKGYIRDKTTGEKMTPNSFCIKIKNVGQFCYNSDSPDPNFENQISFLPGGAFIFVIPQAINTFTFTITDICGYGDLEKDFLENEITGVEFEVEVDPGSDCDGDGMSAGWEKQYGLGIWKNDADSDLDEDDFSNFEEYQAGTDPRAKSSKPQSQGTKSKAMPWIPLLLMDD